MSAFEDRFTWALRNKIKKSQKIFSRANVRVALVFAFFLMIPFDVHTNILRGLSRRILSRFIEKAPFSPVFPPLFNPRFTVHGIEGLMLIMVGLVFLDKKVRWRDVTAHRPTLWLSGFFLAAVVSVAFSPSAQFYTLYVKLAFFALPLGAFTAIHFFFPAKKEVIGAFCWVVFWMALFQCVIGAGQFVLQKKLANPAPFSFLPLSPSAIGVKKFMRFWPSDLKSFMRANGTFPGPNRFGAFLVFSLFVSQFLLITAKNRRQTALLAWGIVFQMAVFAMTFCRSAMLGYVMGNVVWVVIFWLKIGDRALLEYRKQALLLAGQIFLVGLIVLAAFAPLFFSKQDHVGLTRPGDKWRRTSQKICAQMVAQRPVTGVGYRCFCFAPGTFASSCDYPRANYPHDIYFSTLAEMGVLGLTLFLLFLLFLLGRIKNSCVPFSLPFFVTLMSFLLIGLADMHFLFWADGRALFFLVAGLFSATTKPRLKHQILPKN